MANKIEINSADRSKITLDIVGDNNVIVIKKMMDNTIGKISISLTGNNCSIVLDEGIAVGGLLNIVAGQIHPNFGLIGNTHIYIGRYTSFESTIITTFNSNSSIEIGERCMFSSGINVYNTDAHPMIDAKNGNIINKVKALKIGNHVWVGANATILKNTYVPDDCIVGWGSIVNSKSSYPPLKGCIIAGNPAKVVKSGITWDSNGSNGYIQNTGITAQISEKAADIIEHTHFTMQTENVAFRSSNKFLYKIWKHLNKHEAEFKTKPRTFYNQIRYKLWKHLLKKYVNN